MTCRCRIEQGANNVCRRYSSPGEPPHPSSCRWTRHGVGCGDGGASFCAPTSTYPDYYFDMTNCNHMTALKDKFQRICTSHIHTLIRLAFNIHMISSVRLVGVHKFGIGNTARGTTRYLGMMFGDITIDYDST